MPANLRNVVYISIGSELLKGEVLNTNAAFLGRVLFEHGMKLIGERTVPDEEPAMHHAIEAALAQDAGWIVTSGGLGPTFDDVTRQVLSTYFGKPLEFSSYHYKELMKRISRHKIPSQSLQEGIRSQCFFPKGSRIILNKLGSAWGFVMETQGRKIISLPGVAREFETMIQGEIMPKLFLKRGGLSRPVSLTAMAAGISELEFLKRLGGAPREKFVDCGIYPGLGEVRFTAASKGSKESNQAVSRLKEKIKKKLGSYVYAWNLNTSLEQEIAKLLVKKHHTVSCAESCTGGHVSELLTQTPGSSKYFLGGVVAYADAVKEQSVGIPHGIMHRHGAVSREVGEEMAQRIRRRMCSSIGIGITGIAGPSGATKTKPLGLVYISIAGAKRVETRKFVFKGNRERIRKLAAKYALYLLWLKIRSGSF